MAKTLAQCLLRRKEIRDILKRMNDLRHRKDFFENRIRRTPINDNTDEVTANVAKLDFSQFDAEYSHYASQLRQIDAAIQHKNRTVIVEDVDNLFNDYTVE